MNIISQIKKTIEKLFKSDRVCAYHKSFAMIAGDATGGLFLSQLFYWCDKGTRADGYIYKTYQEWHEELHLSLSEWDRAKTQLKEMGIIDYRRFGVDPKLYYKINFDVLTQRLMEAVTNLAEKGKKKSTDEIQLQGLLTEATKVAESIENFPMLNSGLGNSEYRDGENEIDDWAIDNTGLDLYTEKTKKNTYKEDLQRGGDARTENNFGVGFSSQTEEYTSSHTTTIEVEITKKESSARSTVSVNSMGWEEFSWLDELYRYEKPSRWTSAWFPKTSRLLNSLRTIVSQLGGDLYEVKQMISKAFKRVESNPALWGMNMDWVLDANNCVQLAWEYDNAVFAPARKTVENMKQSHETRSRISAALAKFR